MNQNKDSLQHFANMLKSNDAKRLDIMSATTEEEFEAAFFAILERAIIHLEKNKKNFANLDEEGLTGVLAGCWAGIGLNYAQEANSNGHVDLTFTANHCTPVRTKLCEAKIYKGYQKHIEGLKQLLSLYSTGREGSGLLIEYFREDKISQKMKKVQGRMDKERPLRQTKKSVDHAIRWSFLTTHEHSTGEELTVQHIGCNVFHSSS